MLATKEFSQIRFQEALAARLVALWKSGRGRRVWKLHQGKARKQLRKLGYTMDQSYAIVDDAVDMAGLQLECEGL
jgi:hypothetical protein